MSSSKPAPDFAIEVKDLNKIYRASGKMPEKHALKGLNLEIPRGSIFGLLGPNGAGKSTFINILAGLVNKTSGSASIWGLDIDKSPRQSRAAIGVVNQEIVADPFFTPLEMLELMAGFYGVPKSERRSLEILTAVGLDDKKDAYVRQLSGGMKKRVGLARAIVYKPEIILYDEPTTGLDPVAADSIDQLVIRMRDQLKCTTIVVTHDTRSMRRVGNRVMLLHHGEIHANGTPDEIFNSTDPIVHKFVNGIADPKDLEF